MPPRLGRLLVDPLGPLTYHLMARRRRIAQRNIERCFPELSAAEHEEMLRGTFRSLARMLIETAWCWSAPVARLKAITQVEGLENLQDAEESGQGVLLLTYHLTSVEMGGFIIGCTAQLQASGMYRPLRNPVINWYQNRGRKRFAENMISKHDMRRAIRLLRSGGVLWYAPDQDFGRERSEFAPFFGIQTASLLATHRLPGMTGCVVVPMFPRYDNNSGRYTVSIEPALENFPSDDAVADLARVNAIMEEHVRRVPDQYWWIHRRFKTRPPGEPGFYD